MTESRKSVPELEAVFDDILGDLDLNPFSQTKPPDQQGEPQTETAGEEGHENQEGGIAGPEPEVRAESDDFNEMQGRTDAVPFPGGQGPEQAEALRLALLEAASGGGGIAVDLGGAEDLSAECLAVLLAYARDFANGEGLELTGVREKLRAFFEACGVERDSSLKIAVRG